MSELKKCRGCGVELRSSTAFGHCPKCLLELGFGAIPDDAMEESIDAAKIRCFGDYELLEQIGRSGMGVVYKARQLSLSRTVALKMIASGEFASPSAVQRFQIEAEAGAKLDHPNIVPIYGIGLHRGQHYFSMKFVVGRNLAEEIRHGKFGTGGEISNKPRVRRRERAIAQLMATVARSVQYAHQRGVLHRDLKPSNILIDAEGQPHLTDFGLAKILESEIGVTGSKEIFGTPSYMSPEQAAGCRLTTASDIYSLGAIYYELLTGHPPFPGTTPIEILEKLAREEPRHPRTVNALLDSELATICLKCLEKDPQRRYGSANALADDLERWLRHEPILARRASMVFRGRRWTRRNPAVATLLVVLSVALAGALVFLKVLKDNNLAKTEALRVMREELQARLDELWKATLPSVRISADQRALLTRDEIAPVTAGTVRRLNFGIYVHKETPTERLFTFAPVLKHLDAELSKRLQQPVRTDFVVFRSYDLAMDALLNGEVDFLRFGASSYVIAKVKRPDVSILAAQKHRDFNGVIFTQATNSRLRTLQDLKGKSIAFGHTNSTTGSQLARCFLAENGFRASDFPNRATNYLANHAAVASAVEQGRFDAGAAKESFVETNLNLRILGKYPNVGMVWVARPNFDAKAQNAIRGSLLATRSQLLRELEDEVTGFENKTDSDFNSLRKKMAETEKFYQ